MSKRSTSGAIALMIALLLSVSILMACGPKQVPVPDIVGKTAVEAKAALVAAKLSAGAGSQEYSDTVNSGTVISQAPAAGSQAAEGSPVEFVTSKGPRPVAVPDVRGMDKAKADQAITGVGLLMVSYDDDDPTVPAGQAFGQLPAAASEVATGTEIVVGFSTGKPPTDQVVPSVVGDSKSSAISKIKKAGFKVAEESGPVVGAKSGTVVAQVPAQGAKAGPDSHVIIMVASGSPVGAIPPVSGMSRTAANTALSDAGFQPKAYQMFNAQTSTGKAFAQIAAAGAQETHGSVNAFVLSLGKFTATTTPVPTVTGQAEAAAAQVVKSAGFVPVALQVYDPAVPVGSVIAQVPAGGSKGQPGQQVLLSVSLGPISKVEVKVPTVTKMSASEAQSALTKAGLRTQTGRLYSPTVAKGMVMGQLPASGATVLKGSSVEMVISLGKESALYITVPDFTGMTEEAANTQIEDLGLVSVSIAGPEGVKTPGTVLTQFPAAGAAINAGSQVVLMVAR